MLSDLITISAYMFLPVAIEATAFVVVFSAVLTIIEALDSVLNKMKSD